MPPSKRKLSRESNAEAAYDRQLRDVDPATISWHNIEVFSKAKKRFGCFPSDQKPLKIIKDVSGHLKPGCTLAIMGASGAGKTTLLNVLTARNLSMVDVKGVVKINHKLADVKTITELTAYVQQLDLFVPSLTVREHLVFQALVRMDSKLSAEARARRIHEVMVELSLLKCADVRVGGVGFFKGISGGEMKRLSFAVEILTNPAIMFCDEPTSGLDSFMAANLIAMIRRMARKGRTIICTIHQPSTEVFNLFDNLLLLADGRVAYMGELSATMEYFSNLGYRCPTNCNPADFYVNTLAVVPGNELESRGKINMICDYYMKTHPLGKISNQSSFLNTNRVEPYKATRCQQWKALAWRSTLVAIRQPMLLYIRLIQAIIISLMLGAVYFRQEYSNFGVNNINAALFLIASNMVYQNALAVINTFCTEIPIFIREHTNGQYGVAPYFFSKNLAELPVFVLIPIAFVSIIYFMVGLTFDSLANFLFAMTVALFTSTIGIAFGYFMSVLTEKADIALAVTPPLLMPFQLFAGFYVNNNVIPVYFLWANAISFYRYSYELLMYNQWHNVESIACKTSKVQADDQPNDTQMCFKNGRQVMEFYAIDTNIVFFNFSILIAYNIFLRLFGYLALWIRSLQR